MCPSLFLCRVIMLSREVVEKGEEEIDIWKGIPEGEEKRRSVTGRKQAGNDEGDGVLEKQQQRDGRGQKRRHE